MLVVWRLNRKYRSYSCFALQCSFWVWLLSLSGRLAVNTATCSSTILYALSAMTRILFQGKDKNAPCAFWVWLASLSIRFAVDTGTCSTSLSQARYAMTRGLFKGKSKSKSGRAGHTRRLLVGHPLCSFRHDPGCFKAKAKSKGRDSCLYSSTYHNGLLVNLKHNFFKRPMRDSDFNLITPA